jgi:hypothetical protein
MTASVIPGMWDFRGQHGTQNGSIFNPSQYLAGLGCQAVKTTPSLRIPHPSYAVENRVVVIKLVVYEQNA